MDRLPAEIIVHITSYLLVAHKLVSVRVCKQWNKWITENHLYKELGFSDKTMDELKQAITLFQQNQHRRKQVDNLTISVQDLVSDTKTAALIPVTFPRISHLNWSGLERIFEDSEEEKARSLEIIWCNSRAISFYGKISNIWSVMELFIFKSPKDCGKQLP